MWCYLAVSASRDLQSSGCIEALLLGVYNLVCISTFCFGIKMKWLFQSQLFKSVSVRNYNMKFHSLVNIVSALSVVLEFFVTYFLVRWLNSHSAWELSRHCFGNCCLCFDYMDENHKKNYFQLILDCCCICALKNRINKEPLKAPYFSLLMAILKYLVVFYVCWDSCLCSLFWLF